jgi:hypothetical protein
LLLVPLAAFWPSAILYQTSLQLSRTGASHQDIASTIPNRRFVSGHDFNHPEQALQGTVSTIPKQALRIRARLQPCRTGDSLLAPLGADFRYQRRYKHVFW